MRRSWAETCTQDLCAKRCLSFCNVCFGRIAYCSAYGQLLACRWLRRSCRTKDGPFFDVQHHDPISNSICSGPYFYCCLLRAVLETQDTEHSHCCTDREPGFGPSMPVPARLPSCASGLLSETAADTTRLSRVSQYWRDSTFCAGRSRLKQRRSRLMHNTGRRPWLRPRSIEACHRRGVPSTSRVQLVQCPLCYQRFEPTSSVPSTWRFNTHTHVEQFIKTHLIKILNLLWMAQSMHVHINGQKACSSVLCTCGGETRKRLRHPKHTSSFCKMFSPCRCKVSASRQSACASTR